MAKGAIIYSRVSTAIQSEEGSSLDTQTLASQERAESLGVPVLKVYREVYTGAELYDRPLLSEAREAMKTKAYSHFIAYSIDRLSRDPIHLAIIALECDRYGVELLFVTESLERSDEGDLIRYVRGYAAKVEREKIRERCVRGKRAIALSGRIHRAGTDLYGYRRNKEEGKREINEAEAAIVRRIFRMMARGQASVRGLARFLNESGIPAPSIGKRRFKDDRSPIWCKAAVTRILRESTYKGESIAWRWKATKVGGRQIIIERPVEEWIALPVGTAPQIVDVVLWNEAQKHIAMNRAVTRNQEPRQYLLRGFIRCECGERRYAETSKGARYYRCSSRDKRSGHCGASAVRADDCEQFVWERLMFAVQQPQLIRKMIEDVRDESEQDRLKAEIQGLRRELIKSSAGLQKLIRRFRLTDSPVLIEAIESEVKATEAEHNRLREGIAEREAMRCGVDEFKARFNSFQGYCRKVARKLSDNPPFDKRLLLMQALSARVTATGELFRLDIDIAGAGIAVADGETATTFSNYGRNAIVTFRSDEKAA